MTSWNIVNIKLFCTRIMDTVTQDCTNLSNHIGPWFNYAMWVLSWLLVPYNGKHELTCLLLFTFWFVWRLCIFLFSYQLIDKFGSGFILCCLYLEIISSNFIEHRPSSIESFVKEVIMLILKVLLTYDYPGGGIIFRTVQTRPEAHPASCVIGTGPFPGEKAAGEWCWPSTFF
jgi:hypothetical protein